MSDEISKALNQLIQALATEGEARDQVLKIIREASVVAAVISAGGDCMVTGPEARRILGDLSRTQLHRLVKRGSIPEPVYGRYRLSDLKEYISSHPRRRAGAKR